MQNMIDNLINGNLKDARKQSRRFSQSKIAAHLEEMGWSVEKSLRAALYLKTGEDFQRYCDAK